MHRDKADALATGHQLLELIANHNLDPKPQVFPYLVIDDAPAVGHQLIELIPESSVTGPRGSKGVAAHINGPS